MNLPVTVANMKPPGYLIARAIACSMLLLVLPSCGIPNLRPAKPGLDLPANYTTAYDGAASLENSSQVPIEDFFKDPKLSRLICQALAGGNQELRILNEDILIANNVVLGQSGTYLPFVSLGATAGLEKFSKFTPEGTAEEQLQYLPGQFYPGLPGNFLLTANISWQLDIWRQLRNARDAAKLRFLASKEGRNYAVTRLVAEIAENYYMLMALDKRLENLDSIIALQERSLEIAKLKKQFPRLPSDTELPVQRFQAEVSKNQSQRLITKQDIIQVENRINFLVGRYPQPVDRDTKSLSDFINLSLHALSIGVPAQLLQNRPDIRQAERELAATGLDVKVARARFFPQVALAGPLGPAGPYSPIGVQAFNPKYLFWSPESMIVSFAGDIVGPVINKRAIRADYKTANAKQLQAVYGYQRVILNAFTEVVTRVSKVQNYSKSIEIKREQVGALEKSVGLANDLYRFARQGVDYMDVLFAQRDLWTARLNLIETKQEQLSGIVNVYQALGGGLLGCGCGNPRLPQPGPSLSQAPQGGSNPSGTEQLPSPRKLPDYNPTQPGRLPLPSKPPMPLPSPGPTLG